MSAILLNCKRNDLLTAWSRVLEELRVAQLVMKIIRILWIPKFITALPRPRHWTLFWATWIRSLCTLPSRPCVIFHNIVGLDGELLAPPPLTLMPEDHSCRLFETAHSVHSQLSSTHGGRLLKTSHAMVARDPLMVLVPKCSQLLFVTGGRVLHPYS